MLANFVPWREVRYIYELCREKVSREISTRYVRYQACYLEYRCRQLALLSAALGHVRQTFQPAK